MTERISYSGKHCVICGRPAPDTHHIITRGASWKEKADRPANLIDLCRAHHTEVHAIGRQTFFIKYNRLDLLNAAIENKQEGV